MRVSRRKFLSTISTATLGISSLNFFERKNYTNPYSGNPIYQYYHTDWKNIETDISRISNMGYSSIQVPPAQNSRIREHEQNNNSPPLGYQPVDFLSFNSVFGSEKEYQSMIKEAHKYGIKIIADIVLNHAAAGGTSFEERISISDIPQFSSKHLHQPCSIDYSNDTSVEQCWLLGLRDLDHSSSHVRNILKQYVEKHVNYGVDKFRVDAAKHIPEWFFHSKLKNWFAEMNVTGFAEVLTHNVNKITPYLFNGMKSLDYPFYYTMKNVFDGDKSAKTLNNNGLVNYSPSKSVLFVGNHDTDNWNNMDIAQAFILTFKGTPRIYNMNSGLQDELIKKLLNIRKKYIGGFYSPKIMLDDIFAYEWSDGAVCILNTSDSRNSITVNTNKINMRMKDCVHGVKTITNNSGHLHLDISSNSFRCFVPIRSN